jgi:hypothetical protein
MVQVSHHALLSSHEMLRDVALGPFAASIKAASHAFIVNTNATGIYPGYIQFDYYYYCCYDCD